MEFLTDRAHLAIVFLLAVICGGFLSLVFMPEATSIGASGGIMGLIGYMSIYAYRRRAQLPPDFLKNMLINLGFIAAFGLIAYQLIDNFAHLGGFLIGAIYGMNFDFMPELHWRYGYAFSLALMLASAVLPLWYLKRRGWL